MGTRLHGKGRESYRLNIAACSSTQVASCSTKKLREVDGLSSPLVHVMVHNLNPYTPLLAGK